MVRQSVRPLIGGIWLVMCCMLATAKLGAQELRGVYVGGSVGAARLDAGTDTTSAIASGLDNANIRDATVTIDEKSIGLKLLVGHQANRFFAAEAYYAHLGEFDVASRGLIDTPSGPSGTGNGSGRLKVTGLGVDIIGMVPLHGALSAFGRLGLFSWESQFELSAPWDSGFVHRSANDDGVDAKFGAGLLWQVEPNIGFRGEFEYYNVGEHKVRLFSAGLILRF